ncbi:MAG: cation transporter [Proteobacteria bacterium]|nr:cation transporter [Pseudomonadota bacterium]
MRTLFLQLSKSSTLGKCDLYTQAASLHEKKRAGSRVTWVGAGVNAILILIKLLAGILGNSQALIADAVHSLSDFFVDAIVLLGLWAGCKGPDKKHHFGHARIETMASALVGISLIGVSLYLGYEAVINTYNHNTGHPTWLAVAAAALSIVVKEAMYQYTMRVGRRIKSPVVFANAWHQRSDALSSVAVMLGVIAAQINPGWRVLDSLVALLVSFMILVVGLQILWRSIRELVDTAPQTEIIERIQKCIQEVPGVLGQHDLKVRSLGGMHHMHVNILVNGKLSVSGGHLIAEQVERRLCSKIDEISDVIVHVDPAEHKGGVLKTDSTRHRDDTSNIGSLLGCGL